MTEPTLLGSEGGQSTTTQTTQTTQSTTGDVVTKSWHDSLPEELKTDATLSRFKDVSDLAKAYKSAQSLVSKKGVIPPGEKATEEEWGSFYKSLGQPELDKYAIEAPKDKKVNPDMIGKFKEVAHKSGLLPRQAQQVLDFYVSQEADAVAAKAQATQAEYQQGIESLKKEWGQAWDKNVSAAKLAVKELGGPEFAKYLEESGMGNDPRLISLMAKAGKLLGEDKLRGATSGSMARTPDEIRSEIDRQMANPAYFDQANPMHRSTRLAVEELFKSMYPS